MSKKEQQETKQKTTSKQNAKTHVASTATEELEKKLTASSENFLRLQAEFANFKKRAEEQQARIYASATCNVLKEFVKVFDDFELALKHTNNADEFKKGMEMIFAKFITTGEEMGLERIKTVGEKFDPYQHEALLAEQSKKEENSILEELQSGYKVKDVVIRTAKVKVAKK
ncbi:nucleotide exchange factor GrpE [Candidatus Woesearchaeota archaeon]|nr:nucleotide exchange factor GrpE [Candidatus Woesearchaeota archaeon]